MPRKKKASTIQVMIDAIIQAYPDARSGFAAPVFNGDTSHAAIRDCLTAAGRKENLHESNLTDQVVIHFLRLMLVMPENTTEKQNESEVPVADSTERYDSDVVVKIMDNMDNESNE